MNAATSTRRSNDPELMALLSGLSSSPPRVAPKYFYDARGSALFAKITETAEYYPTRTELAILRERGRAIAAHVARGSVVIELGSGSGDKVLALLSHLTEVRAYRPIDISGAALELTEKAVRAAHPELQVLPYRGDFTDADAYRGLPSGHPKLVFYSGSTIGNFDPADAVRFLSELRAQLTAGDVLLLGADLVKDEALLNAAYNDKAGFTAAFNRNLLAHLNTRFGCNFVPEAFDHRAAYNARQGRIEMHLVPHTRQEVEVAGERLTFDVDRPIHTESSYKYEIDTLRTLAEKSGFVFEDVVSDARGWFAEAILRVGALA